MKNTFLAQRLLIAFVLIVIVIAACKKTETVTITIQEPTARFSVMVPDRLSSTQSLGTTSYIDSNFYFRNTSDSGANITYRWDFGDGASSTEKNPKHPYAKRGTYTVTLTVSNDNRASATAQQALTVTLGQQDISLSGNNVSPVAIEETSTSDFVLLGSLGYGKSYALFQLDSLLKQKSIKMLPANYSLLSMKATNDASYILTGSTQSTTKSNELIKMKADGTLLWNKALSTDDIYTSAAQTPDGGYAVVGLRLGPSINGNSFYNTVIVKTDGSGNPQWQKLLDQEGMINSNNAVVEQDGIVVAGTKRGTCTECDSIFVVKVNNAGSVVWKATVLGGLNNSTWSDGRIAKLANGNYAVTNNNIRGIYIFSPSGSFLDRRLAPSQVASVISASDGNLIALQTEYGNGFRFSVSKLTLDGALQWTVYPDGRQKISGGILCCSDSRPGTIQPLRNGGFLVTGSRNDYTSTGSGIQYATVLLELDENGKAK